MRYRPIVCPGITSTSRRRAMTTLLISFPIRERITSSSALTTGTAILRASSMPLLDSGRSKGLATPSNEKFFPTIRVGFMAFSQARSEERRVGKECRSPCSPPHPPPTHHPPPHPPPHPP